ncbi:MAG TPA: ABC transporter substrate-binding protein [Candidatus Tectomicrobia bacterium]|nr:ABC transporter substrate-binding protein [Candidatus Tectomicrobia bacterium]
MAKYAYRTGFPIAIFGCLLLVHVAVWAQQPKLGGTLRVAWESDIAGLDPHLSPGAQGYYVMGNLFNSLVSIDAELNYVPDLAESWEILENGKVYVFRLRQGVKFHDGTDFDAEAVRWNYRRITNPEEKALDAPSYSIVDSVEVLDGRTIQFTLKYPSATLLPVMAAHAAGFLQMSPASYQRWGKEEVRLHPVGTGPFKLANWEQNRVILLEKNPHYFKPGLPYLDRIELRIIKEGVTRVTALRTGEVDFANVVPREHVERLSKDAKIQLLKGRDTLRINSYFNQGRALFKDVRVRRALLGYGVDRPAIVRTALLGQAQPLWSFVPSGGKGHIEFHEQFPYDPEKAKALLKEAGYDERNPLRYTLMTHSAEAALPTIATILKTQYARLGVDVTVEVLDRPIFLRRWQRDRDWDQILGVSGAAFDSYQLSRVLDTRAGNNTLNHDDKQVNALIDRMKEAPTEAALLQGGYDFQRYVMDQMMTCGIASLPFLQAARADVKGYVHLHGYKIPFETTWLDRP